MRRRGPANALKTPDNRFRSMDVLPVFTIVLHLVLLAWVEGGAAEGVAEWAASRQAGSRSPLCCPGCSCSCCRWAWLPGGRLSLGVGLPCRPSKQASVQSSYVPCPPAGLGYYRRARYLLEGAQYVVSQLGGAFPTTSKELQKIPGGRPPSLLSSFFVFSRIGPS